MGIITFTYFSYKIFQKANTVGSYVENIISLLNPFDFYYGKGYYQRPTEPIEDIKQLLYDLQHENAIANNYLSELHVKLQSSPNETLSLLLGTSSNLVH